MVPRDDRGVSPVIGAVLLAGILVLLLTVLQINAVPTWNERVEFDHSERVQGDLLRLQEATLSVAADGNRRSVTVDLGADYPQRFVLRNPADPSGRLSTGPAANLTLRNVTAPGEAGDYWDGAPRNLSTRALVYAPSYNYYRDAPETVYEGAVLYNRFPEGDVALAEQGLVDGNRVTLIALAGNLSVSSPGSTSVEVGPASAPALSTTITNSSDGPIVLSIPTRLPNSTWADLLSGEYVGSGGHVVDQSYRTGGAHDRLVLTLERGVTYELRTARIAVADDVRTEGKQYVVGIEGDGVSTSASENVTLVAEVRDRFNNPVSSALVNASVVSGAGSVSPADARTDADGRVAFTFSSASATTATVEVDIATSPAESERATFEVEVGAPTTNVGPETTDVRTNTSSLEPGERFSLTANASDVGRGGLQIIAAEWFRNTTGDPGEGNANRMDATDGGFDTVEEEVENASVDTTGWGTGTHTISVRGRDANGRWGAVANTTVTVVGDPSFGSLAIDDGSSPGNARFDVDYSIDDPHNRFENVTVTFENLDDPGATETQSSTAETDAISHTSGGSNGDSYEITVRIYDVDGEVVRTEVHTETADGSGETVIV